jgi:hypothetical protein
MKQTYLKIGIALLLAATLNSNAFADVDRLAIRFGGGCQSDNTNGSCTIRVTASGTDLDSETVQLYTAAKPGDPLKRFSPRLRALDQNGRASFRVKNVAGRCYQARTGPNGNDKPDRRSRTICA